MHHQQTPAVHQQAPSSGGMMSGLGGALATGMAMGAGSEIAHQAIRGVMGSGSSSHAPQQQQAAPQQMQAAPVQYAQPTYEQQQQQQQSPCQSFNQSFLSCLKDNSGNISMCQSNMDMLMQCEKDNTRFYGFWVYN